MERDFDDDSLELFIQQKVDHYKMYPSEKVWKGIYNTLHSRKRWFTVGGSFFLISALLFLGQEFMLPGSRTIVKRKTITHPVLARPHLPTIPGLSANIDLKTSPSAVNAVHPEMIVTGSVPSRHTIYPVTKQNTAIAKADERLSSKGQNIEFDGNPLLTPDNSPVLLPKSIITGAVTDKQSQEPFERGNSGAIGLSLVNGDETPGVEASNEHKINWLQEIAAIKLTPKKKNRFNLQFYFSPTVSYRKLSDNKSNFTSGIQNIPLSVNHLNVDRYVDHVPSVGVELGSNLLYFPLKNLTLKTGLQLNYSRYNIKAYKFYYEKASIALNRVGSQQDTITAFTSLRNFNGNSPEALQNQYLQVSMPVGAEFKLIGNKRLQLNIAGTIQPTYLLFNDTYLLSMDYVNYAKEESLVRKWNVHTSVEAFLSYKLGGVRWQLGPQFRYQLMSSYNDSYPIKEYLIEYGVKVGVSKTLR